MSRREFSVPIHDRDLHARLYRNREEFASTSSTFLAALGGAFGRGTSFPERVPGLPDEHWRNFPWFTPVVGSGPLGLPKEFLDSARFIPAAVRDRVDQLPMFAEDSGLAGIGQDEREWSRAFAARLVHDRIGMDVPEGTSSGELAIGDLALYYLLLSAQLTRLFHRISLDTSRPVSRWGSAIARREARTSRAAETQREYLGILSRLLTECATRIESHRTDRFPVDQLSKLLERIQANADRGEVDLLHVQQITEIAWNFLVEDVGGDPTYPGWTDLLLELVLDSAIAVDEAYRRPRIEELQKIADHIRRIHGPTTGHFYPDAKGESHDSRAFYDSVARTMWAQDRARNTERERAEGKGDSLPYATAFVVSFDLELELAMLRTAETDQTGFIVLVPMFLSRRHAEDAEFVWIEAHVDVRATKEASNPSVPFVSKWIAVHPDRNVSELPAAPVIVRLVGAPWYTPPPLGPAGAGHGHGQADRSTPTALNSGELLKRGIEVILAATDRSRDAEGYQLTHAIMLSEYYAVLLSHDEWSATQEGAGRAIPVQYLQTSASAQRYWGILGVPFRDPAVRARVLPVLARQFGSGPRVMRADSEASTATGTDQGSTAVEVPDSAEESASSDPRTIGRVRAAPAPPALRPMSGLRPRRSRSGPPSTPPTLEHEAALVTAPAPTGVPRSGVPAPAAAGGEAVGRRLRGVSINRQIDDDEVSILLGLGLNVVLAQCETFSADLEAYAEWIDDGARGRG